MYASKINNQDAFLGSLYGQQVVDELDEWFLDSKSPPLDLQQHLTTTTLRVQKAVAISCGKNCFKHLVVALEWSKNENLLTEILVWAEKVAKEAGLGVSDQDVPAPAASSPVPDVAERAEKYEFPMISTTYDILTLAETLLDGTCLPTLGELSLDVNFHCLREGYEIVRDGILDLNAWKRCFPNLEKLKLFVYEAAPKTRFLKELKKKFQNSRQPEQGATASSGLKVKRLDLSCKFLDVTETELQLIAKLCPQVKHLAMREAPGTGQFPFGYNLENIQYLEFHISTILGNLNLDRLMCGLNYEELQDLKGKDAGFLKTVHIVPTEPSITHLPNLKILKVVLRGPILPGVSAIVSRVSAGICYSRIPGLILQLEMAIDPSFKRDAEQLRQEILAKLKDFPEVNTRIKFADAQLASFVITPL